MFVIRELISSDYTKLEEFLYLAIFIKPNEKLPKREIIFEPNVFVYIKDFGNKNDCGVIAEVDGKAVGIAWARIISAYGSVDLYTPELAISVLPKYRNQNIGTKLMKALFENLIKRGYTKTSLAVQKENPAVNFYLRLGYEVVEEKLEEYLMVKHLITK